MCEFCMVDAKMGTKYVLLTYSGHTSSKYVTIMRLCIYTYYGRAWFAPNII